MIPLEYQRADSRGAGGHSVRRAFICRDRGSVDARRKGCISIEEHDRSSRPSANPRQSWYSFSPLSVELAPSRKGAMGFTLIELLLVVGMMALMMSLVVPAFNAMGGSTGFSSEVYNVADTLQEARAYAISNNTYVLAGIMEVSSAYNPFSTAPVKAGIGTVVMALVASNSGVRPYTAQAITSGAWAGATMTGTYFSPVTKLRTFTNLHLVDLQSGNPPVPASGNMMRPQVAPVSCDIPSASGSAANVFGWPLTSTYSSATYPFTKVIEFDPQGSARVITAGTSDLSAINPEIEISLQPVHGAAAPALPSNQNTGQQAAIQIDGITGSTHIYRP